MGMSSAKFPCVRTLEGFEYDAQPSVDPKQVSELATSCWVASRRYERGSMPVTSSVAKWGGVLGDAVVATVIFDRLLHHSHVITIRGDSYRLRTKRPAGLVNQASRTVEPATN